MHATMVRALLVRQFTMSYRLYCLTWSAIVTSSPKPPTQVLKCAPKESLQGVSPHSPSTSVCTQIW